MTTTDQDIRQLFAADRKALGRLLRALVQDAGAAEIRAGCLADSARVRAAGRMDYSFEDATEAERERVTADPVVRLTTDLFAAVEEANAAAVRAAKLFDQLPPSDPSQ